MISYLAFGFFFGVGASIALFTCERLSWEFKQYKEGKNKMKRIAKLGKK